MTQEAATTWWWWWWWWRWWRGRSRQYLCVGYNYVTTSIRHHSTSVRLRFDVQLQLNFCSRMTVESSRTGVERRWIRSRIVAVTNALPVYPIGQIQVYDLWPSRHEAPFWHLWFRQSLDLILHLVDTSSQPAEEIWRSDLTFQHPPPPLPPRYYCSLWKTLQQLNMKNTRPSLLYK